MKLTKLLLFFILIITSFLTYKFSLSYFSDTGQSTDNILSASATFPSPVADHVVISEVQINGGPGDAGHDFVEFYNPTNSPYDLNGHRLVSRTGNSSSDNTMKSWTSSSIIPAFGYYLWASTSDSDSPFIAVADATTSYSLTSSHSIALRNGPENTGAILDSLSWNEGSTLGEGTVFSPNPDANQSMERKAYSTSTAVSMGSGGSDEFEGNGFDSNNNATDFYLRAVSQPQNSSSPTEVP